MAKELNSGWSSSPFASGLTPKDSWARSMHMRYGGRTDDIWQFHMNKESEMGSMRASFPRSGGSSWMGSGEVAFRAPRSGGSNNPGGYNWNTFGNVVNNTVGAVGQYKMGKWAEDYGEKTGLDLPTSPKAMVSWAFNAPDQRRKELKHRQEMAKAEQMQGIRDLISHSRQQAWRVRGSMTPKDTSALTPPPNWQPTNLINIITKKQKGQGLPPNSRQKQQQQQPNTP